MSVTCRCRCRTGHLRTEDDERSGRPIEVTIPGDGDAIHSMIPELGNISTEKQRRDPGDILRKSRLYYSRNFRREKALSQMS
jgi:hypothetical protein